MACAAILLMIPVIRKVFGPKGGTTDSGSDIWDDGPGDELEETRTLEYTGGFTKLYDVLLSYDSGNDRMGQNKSGLIKKKKT